MNISEEIKTIFITRDTAVRKHDRNLFLSTQLAEIEYSAWEGYSSIEKLTSEVLFVYEKTELEAIVLVKETYSPREKEPYSSFPVYCLIHSVKGWKIYRVR